MREIEGERETYFAWFAVSLQNITTRMIICYDCRYAQYIQQFEFMSQCEFSFELSTNTCNLNSYTCPSHLHATGSLSLSHTDTQIHTDTQTPQ